ncbi:MAG: hypothetical protein RIT40_2012 [Planctomycetota bacterium]
MLVASSGASLSQAAPASVQGVQDEELYAEERAECARLGRRGQTREALRRLDELLADRPQDKEALLSRAEIRLREGRVAEAWETSLALCASETGPLASSAARLALHCAAVLGGERLSEALDAQRGLDRWLAPGADARDAWALGNAHMEAGQRTQARQLYAQGAKAEAREWTALLARGHCLRALGRLADASRDYVAAIKLAEDGEGVEPDALVALADVYFEADREVADASQRSASKLYDQALSIDPDHERALLGQFALHSYNWLRQRRSADEFLRRALSARPRSPETLLVAVGADLQDGDLLAARSALRVLSEVAPERRATVSAHATLAFLEQDLPRAEALIAALEARDAGDGAPARDLGRILVEQYRFAEALPWLVRATTRNPSDHEALTYLGRAQANTGDEVAALATLNRSAEAAEGRADAWRDNMRLVLTRMAQRHVVVEQGPLSYSWEAKGREVLEELMTRFYADARLVLSERYGFTPSPTRIEVFGKMADFSVRSVGFEGFPALGVCFGPVVTAVSPLAEMRGTQSWARTAYHEFTHVIHLGISKNRCPRWITEGIATWEEETRNPAWTRNLRRELIDALANDDLLQCRTINRAFRGSRVIYAYYQAGLMVRMVVEKQGFAPLVRLLEAFERGQDLDQAFRSCLSTTPEQFDRDFEAWARVYVAKLRVEPRLSVATAARLRTALAGKAPNDTALRAAWAEQWISVARASFLAGKRVDAEDALRRLKGIEPEPARATLLRAEIALQQDDDERALELLLKAFAAGAEDYRARFTAGKLLDMAGDKPAAIVQMQRAAAIFPGWDDPSLSAELELSELYKQQGDEEKALEARERRLDWDAGTLPLRLQVAKAWMERGRPERAIVRLEEALEIDPFVRSIYSDLAAAQEATSDHSGAARSWRMVQKVPAELDVLDNTSADDQLRATWMGREALALARSGQVAEAHARAQAALQLDPDQAAAKEALDYKE